jgi:hypothetical protein
MAEYYFNLPPFDELNPTQKEAVLDPNAIALSGGPGTGKSVVSIWRHILNHQRENPVRSQLLTFTTSLALYLKRCCHTQNENASDYVDSSQRWRIHNANNRPEILHDEAQDLSVPFNKGFLNYTQMLSYGADNQQLIRANSRLINGDYNLDVCSPESALRGIFPDNSLHSLDQNYRNSSRIMKFAKSVFNNAVIPQEIIESCTNEGEFPRFILANNNAQIDQTVIQLVNDFTANNTTNIGILVPFENQNRMAGETATVRYYFNLLRNNNVDVTMYTNAMNGIESINTVHVTTFKSSKGLEFDVVIIPDFHLLNLQFNVVDWRDFYVGITRAKSNLFLLSRVDFPNLYDNGINKVIDKVIL